MQNLMPPIDTPDNLFHDGDPTKGAEGTIVTAKFLNDDQSAVRDVQQEVINVLTAAGIEPDPANQSQLLAALKSIIGAPAAGFVKTVSGTGPDVNGNVDAPVSSVNDKTGAVKLTAADVGALPDDYQPPGAPVTSVNAKTGVVVLTAVDVGALPDDYVPPAAPVASVNGKTGAVTLTAAEVGVTLDSVGTNQYALSTNGTARLIAIGGIASDSNSNPDVTITLGRTFPSGITAIGGSFAGSGGDDSDSWWTATIVNAGSFKLHSRNCSGTWSFVVMGH